ncbi:hypothetical protein ABN764_26080 [Paenibacillaceae sp. P-4]|uniref:hypothetical protein n=1 Tax=Paenibacillaceae bacterium P-4 TaxID=3160969 RepID=UPI0032E8292A
MLFAVPVVILILGKIKFKTSISQLPGGKELIQSERSMVDLVFVFAAFMWITRGFLWGDGGLLVTIPGISDGMIAIAAAILLFIIPTKSDTSSRILNWSDSKDIPWGVLLLLVVGCDCRGLPFQ